MPGQGSKYCTTYQGQGSREKLAGTGSRDKLAGAEEQWQVSRDRGADTTYQIQGTKLGGTVEQRQAIKDRVAETS